ncbi:tetratricopeptide repeat protein [Actinokineospora soli]|uniref:Tetratricopeptide repeat protein n=1 Tax=Actinokineospora soli TaxID=1048753 RepID=A0ABW2TXM2_9PSEU
MLAYGAAFDRPLCAAVWDRDPKPPLDGLRHRAMLAIAPEPGWYQQHQLLRAYARALLRQDPPRHERTEDRYTAHVTAVCAGVDGDWRALDPLLPHVEEAGAILVGRPPGPAGLAFALATRTLLAQRKEVRHPEWLELGLAVATERMDRSYEALFLNALSQDHSFRGNARATVQLLHRARQVAESARDLAGMAATESNLGEFMLQSDPDTAPKHLWRAVSLHEELGDAEGLVDALLRIARWQANRYRAGFAQREDAFATLDRAASVAADAGLARAVAEVRAQAGALHDSLGDREAAETALADAVARFADLGLRDREAEARVRLASALASLGRFAEAEDQLTASLPLVKSTGHAVAHAVALRNLGQLRARQGRPAEALAHFAEALPLTRGQTEHFLDEDFDDDRVAVGYFTADIDLVAKLDQVEHFRQTAVEQPPPPLLPGELLTYLITGTLRQPPDWAAALRGFVVALTEPDHADFATALADLVEGRPIGLPEDHPYRPYVERIAHRLASGNVALTGEQALQCAQNTLLVLLKRPEQRREWMIELRKLRRHAAEWGDEDDRDYFHALLAVLDNRVIALPDHNPHHEVFAEVQEMLANFSAPPAQLLVERTVAAATVAEDRRADWAEALRETRTAAARRGERHEQVFVGALETLLRHGDEVMLPDDNPYRRSYADAVAAVAAGRTVFAPPAPAELAFLADRVLVARTSEPKTFDVVVADLTRLADECDGWGDAAGASVFRWLVDLLHDEAVGDPPDDALRELQHEVAAAQPRPCADDPLPPEQVEGLARLVVRARTDAPESGEWARENLADYARVLTHRSADWASERAFVAALRAVVDDEPVPDAGPYAGVVGRVVEDIRAHHAIRAGGGVLTPGYLTDLLRRTGTLWRAAQDTMARFVEAGDFAGALGATRPATGSSS